MELDLEPMLQTQQFYKILNKLFHLDLLDQEDHQIILDQMGQEVRDHLDQEVHLIILDQMGQGGLDFWGQLQLI